MFLLDSGIRGAECVNLKVANIDMKSGVVTVEQGKGRKDRLVRIGARTRKQLMKYLSEVKPKERIWLSDKGKPLSQFGLIQALERLSQRAGINKVTPHQLRRTFAINCLRNGMDVYILAKLMGHADISVLRRYLDIKDSDLENGHKASGPVDNMDL